MRISVYSSRELQGVILGLKAMEKDLAKEIRQHTKRVIEVEWKKAVAENVMSRPEARVLANTARVAVSNQNVTLKSAGIGRPLSGGGRPTEIYGGVEFGGNPDQVTTYQRRSPRGRTHQVKRHTQRQFRPHNRRGYVVYPAAARIIPRLAALWVQTTVRTFYEAIERR